MPHLVTVSGTRIPLRRGHSYVVGRGLDCDIVVEDTACSRRHAQLALARNTTAAYLEDLGSRNGTFLNGEPVRSRVSVRDSDRIQVGASVFLARLREEPEEIDLAETGTVGFETGPLTQAVEGGEFAAYGVIDLLRLLYNARRSATLHVALPDGHAIVEVRDGEVLAADYAGLEGFNALVRLGRQSSGIFWLVDAEGECERNVTQPCIRLVTELGRCLDPAAAPRAP